MSDLATLQQLTDRMKITPDPVRAAAVLADVSAAVRSYTGQTITRATTTERLRVSNSELRLSQHPVHSVVSALDVDGNALDARWDGLDRLFFSWPALNEFELWRPLSDWTGVVDVTYDHGYDDVPEDVLAVVCNVAARAMGSAPETAGVVQQSITNYSVSIGPVGASGSIGLFDSERAILERYRRWVATWL